MGLRSLAIGAAFAAPMVVQGQTAVLRTLMARDTLGAPPPAVLWLVEAPGSQALSEGFAALLQKAELKVYQVPVRRLVLDRASDKALLARHHLSLASQWILVASRTEAPLVKGVQLPTPAALAQTLEQVGFRDRAKELRAYLKRNPQVIEAREQLLALLRQRGEAATQQIMGVEVHSSQDRLEQGDLAGALQVEDDPGHTDLSHAKPLDPIQDLEAWSAFTQELDGVFRTGTWREMDFAWTREGRPLDAASPTLQGLYLRWLPTVEAALREEPSASSRWSLWIWMSEALGGRPLRPLLESLRPSPLTPTGEWPPMAVLRQWRETARTPSDWLGLKALYQALWEEQPHTLRDTPESASLPLERDWDQFLSPLLESCLRSGDMAQADALLREAMEASHWPALATKGAALAGRCGQPALAARWAALKPGASR